ncbi:hypothetical protein P3X46_004100 [Hevea brasiliensis]|uniref:Uncharacterized protein n=1 Tax=Hevea brasiliensis TaxID=3981 RepID=A0ABQ9MWK6_HEVBR|nr:hypothetical protein P3X46_004100 [Hevea brasiliensis]
MGALSQQVEVAEQVTCGIIVNSFEELEAAYVQEYKKVMSDKIGVKVGTEVTVRWGNEENVGILVKREAVTRAIQRLMDEG